MPGPELGANCLRLLFVRTAGISGRLCPWGGSRTWLSQLNPDVVIVNSVTAGAVIGNTDPAEYYECLAAGWCGYERVLSRGAITVYGRSGRADALFQRVPVVPIPGCDAALRPERP